MRFLALDVGEKRIGVAVSDPTGILASPLTTINRHPENDAIGEILGLVEEHEAGRIIIGVPLTLSGEIGTQAIKVDQFKKILARNTDVAVIVQDERYSTVQAERLMIEAGIKPSRQRSRVDAAAATVILQAYIDGLRNASERF